MAILITDLLCILRNITTLCETLLIKAILCKEISTRRLIIQNVADGRNSNEM